ncbi:hypothetical protein NDU88_002701 [Pleurodeles waltl]|uniref:Uncharacterized protein n=1 Tax=Pleurodeles waltl TaxID=8319 RepID=A0AAV7PAT5_PLEWA|nr:hypothetical protein NDU88_002701 [Pleurodeles waltl]
MHGGACICLPPTSFAGSSSREEKEFRSGRRRQKKRENDRGRSQDGVSPKRPEPEQKSRGAAERSRESGETSHVPGGSWLHQGWVTKEANDLSR